MSGSPAWDRRTDWFGHPRGLSVLFLTEMWAQASYYGMRAILVFYMIKQLHLGQAQASVVYGVYTSFAYFTPVIGGAISDRWLGPRRSVILGGLIMAAGHFMMASEGLFYPALACIAVGNGFFLPTLSSQVRDLYAPQDPRAGSAYTIYYAGINLGAFIAPLACGTVGELYGWHWGFVIAGVGMLFGLAVYIAGLGFLPPQQAAAISRKAAPIASEGGARVRAIDTFLVFAAIAACVVVFRGAYEQIGNTLPLWAENGVDRGVVGGLSIPMTWFQSVNPMVVLAATPFLARIWTRQAARGRGRSAATRMVVGAGLVSLAYLALAAIAWSFGSRGAATPWPWLLGFLVLLTIGELYILPVGLGLFGRLAPQGFSAFSIAAWFSAAFAGNLVAGGLGTLWSRIGHVQFFLVMAAVAALAAGLLSLCVRPSDRLETSAQTAPGVAP